MTFEKGRADVVFLSFHGLLEIISSLPLPFPSQKGLGCWDGV